MSDHNNETQAFKLALDNKRELNALNKEHKKDIDLVKKDTLEAIKSVSGIGHKVDLLNQSHKKLIEEFGYSRKTGFDALQSAKDSAKDIGEIKQMFKNQEIINEYHKKEIDRVETIAKDARQKATDTGGDLKWFMRPLTVALAGALFLSLLFWFFTKINGTMP